MRLVILPEDSSVNKDGIGYSGMDLGSCNIPSNIHALQWLDNSGWLEFKDPVPNQDINELPAWASACLAVWEQTHQAAINPQPPSAYQNKVLAIANLVKTDWAVIADVGDPTKSNPYLENVQDFINYRNSVRQIAINPVAGEIAWPELPNEIWQSI